MPEINSKKVNQHKKGSRKKKSPKNKKVKRAPSGAGLKWGSTEEKKTTRKITREQTYIAIAVLAVFFLFILWAFVDDRPEWQRWEDERAAERAKNESLKAQQERTANARFTSYDYALLLNSTSFSQSLQQMQSGDDDRLMVVAFEDSTKEESAGNAYKVRLFKKFDGIAKRVPKHKLFKRYNEDEIPLFVLFDCGSTTDVSAESVCKQIVGDNVPNILIFRPLQQPRALPTDLKSDTQIITYLYNLMQPAVKYLEELIDAEDFVADDSELHTVLFTNPSDSNAIRVYDEVSDILRDFGKFGRTRNQAVIESFDLDEQQLPSLLVWRTFGENPQIFSGNITSHESVRDFIMNNFVPIFGEFTPMTSKRYMKRGLPILWVSHNSNINDDAKQLLLNTALSIAKRYKGQLTFVQLDVDSQPQIAQNFGLTPSGASDDEDRDDEDEDDEYDDDDEDEDEDGSTNKPHVFIMNQVAQIKKVVNMDDIEGTIQNVIDEYSRQLRVQRGDIPDVNINDDIDYDDEEFEEDDDDDEDDEEEDDEDEEEEEEEQEKPKTDL